MLVAEFTVKLVALTLPNLTCVAPRSPVPTIMTGVPTGPLVGVKLLITGSTKNCELAHAEGKTISRVEQTLLSAALDLDLTLEAPKPSLG
jgi:hypothetical protein